MADSVSSGQPLPASVGALVGERKLEVPDFVSSTSHWKASPTSYRVAQVRVWFNVFIPDVGDSILPWPNLPGNTVIRTLVPPAPIPIRLFATDQRGFSPKSNASSRFQCRFDLWLGTGDYATQTGQGLELTESLLRVGETIEVNGAGKVVDRATAVPSLAIIGPPQLAENVWTIPLRVAASDPVVSGAPTVGVEGEIVIACEKDGSLTVSFGGNVDHWPCFEMYAQSVLPFGPPVTVLNVETDPGANGYDLMGPRDKWVVGSAKITW